MRLGEKSIDLFVIWSVKPVLTRCLRSGVVNVRGEWQSKLM